MDLSEVCLYAFLLGVLTGLRSFTPLAVVSWAARLKWLPLGAAPLAFLGYAATPYIFSLLAVGELIADKLPFIPSRKSPGPFVWRIVAGAVCGCALAYGSLQTPIAAGLIGAAGGVAGTLGGYEFRRRLVKAIGGRDFPIALLEDCIAIGGSVLIVSRFS
jgi:uncharacterized membrane protein